MTSWSCAELTGSCFKGDARVKVEWVEREQELSVICIKVVVKRKGRNQSTEMGSVHNVQQRV